jgi:SAM-dependent methyltransferase
MHQRDDDIYASAPLRRLLDEQTRALKVELQRCHGTHGLLLRAASDDAPPALPMLGCWTSLRLDGDRYRGDLRAAADEPLPFVDDAFDLALLRHVMEAAPNASALLEDAVRVLAPGGLLVLTGVHPFSAWGPWFYWRTRGKSRTLHMPLRLGHDLRQAGLEIERMQRVGQPWPGREVAGPTSGNVLGGGYVLIARKRRPMLLPRRIKPKPVAVRVPSSGQWSPGARRSSPP